MDPTAGSLREPLLKVFHLLRAMEFEPAQYYEQALINRNILEQMVFESPTVFNYYQPGERSDLMIQNMPIAGAFLSVTNLLNGNKCVQSINQSINQFNPKRKTRLSTSRTRRISGPRRPGGADTHHAEYHRVDKRSK